MQNLKFDFDDILISPSIISDIESRSEINIHYPNNMLPLMTAPMDTVVSVDNLGVFIKNGITPIIPRTTPNRHHTEFKAYGLDEFIELYIKQDVLQTQVHLEKVLIDVANGHMKKLYDAAKTIKQRYGNMICLMVGNVADPFTYKMYADIGVDLIRVGVGNGSGCLTTQQTGIGYPMASLISECYAIKKEENYNTQIVADGGMKKYADVIKALALGASQVMLGSILNKALESAGDTYMANIKHDGWTEPGEKVNQYNPDTKLLFNSGAKFYKKFRGMSTKEVQRKLGYNNIKTSEGITRMQPVEYTLNGWVENFSHYLKSAMSYTNCKTLEDFIGKVEYQFITQNALNRFSK